MHSAIRSAIAFNMRGIVAQKLLPSIKPGLGRVPTVEIMTFTPMITKLVLEGSDEKLSDAIRIGAEEGMQDFTMSLKQLIDEELIDRATGYSLNHRLLSPQELVHSCSEKRRNRRPMRGPR